MEIWKGHLYIDTGPVVDILELPRCSFFNNVDNPNLQCTSWIWSSSHVHPFGIKNPKNHCFINVILQIIHSVLRSTHQKIYINNCVEGKLSECLFDTAHKTPSAQEVETLKLQLSTYNSFFTGEIQEGACEGLMLLITPTQVMAYHWWIPCETLVPTGSR